MQPLTRDWVGKAENDFKVAAQIMRRRKDPVPDAVCFHCQQCVEKYLKARLVEAGISFPKSHDLFLLVNLAGAVEPQWLSFSSAAKAITNYAVDFRYPGHSATVREARNALKHCRLIRLAVRRRLGLKA
jgi:HEPN domain-containing protein